MSDTEDHTPPPTDPDDWDEPARGWHEDDEDFFRAY